MKTKGANQLCSYCTADLSLCFRRCMLLVFLCGGSTLFSIFNYRCVLATDMAKHNEIVNNFKAHLEHFDFHQKEHKYLVCSSYRFYLNPLMTNGFTHRYHLVESTLIFRGFRCDFKILFHFSMMKFRNFSKHTE